MEKASEFVNLGLDLNNRSCIFLHKIDVALDLLLETMGSVPVLVNKVFLLQDL